MFQGIHNKISHTNDHDETEEKEKEHKQQSFKKSNERKPKLSLNQERAQYGFAIGIDEVGVGCAAGNLLVCAVYFTPDFKMENEDANFIIKDSKAFRKGTEKLRSITAKRLQTHSHIKHSIAEYSPMQVDEWNPRQTRLKGFTAAAQQLIYLMTEDEKKSLRTILIDGDLQPSDLTEWLQEQKLEHVQVLAVVKGDAHSYSIAAASIIAKTVRDQQMNELHEQFPQYGFNQHKGYCHLNHKLAIQKHGLTPFHRQTYNMELTEKEEQMLDNGSAKN